MAELAQLVRARKQCLRTPLQFSHFGEAVVMGYFNIYEIRTPRHRFESYTLPSKN